MNNGMNPVKTEADVERAWFAALLDEQIENPRHITLSVEELASYGNDADVMMTIARREIKRFIAAEAEQIYAERTQADAQTQIKEILSKRFNSAMVTHRSKSERHPLGSWKRS